MGARGFRVAARLSCALLALALPWTGRAADPDAVRNAAQKFLEQKQYAEAETAARSLLADVEARKGAESSAAAESLDLLVEALWRQGKAKAAEARPLGERAVAIRERIDPGAAELGLTLGNLGLAIKTAEGYEAAKPFYRRAVAILEKAWGPDDARLLPHLERLGTSLARTGDYPPARALFERVLAIEERTLAPDDPKIAATEHILGNVLRWSGDGAAAADHAERALAIRERALPAGDPLVAESLNLLAILRDDRGDFDAARPLYERALSIRGATFGADSPEVAETLTNLAGQTYETGDAQAAIPLYERVLAIEEKAFGAEDARIAGVLLNLGSMHEALGEYAPAMDLYRRALAIREKALGPEHPDLVIILKNVASLLEKLGDVEAAEANASRALAIAKRALSPAHEMTLSLEETLAGIRLRRGDPAGASRLAEEALAAAEGAFGPDDYRVALRAFTLARVRLETHREAEAAALLERAVAIGEKVLGEEHPMTLTFLDLLAEARSRAGDLAAAKRLLTRDVEITERKFGADHLFLASPLRKLAGVDLALGDTGEAVRLALRAGEIDRRQSELIARSLPERQALGYADARPGSLDPALTALAHGAAADAVRAVWDGNVRSRALVLDAVAARHRPAPGGERPEVAALTRSLATERALLASLVVRGPEEHHPERYRAALEEARAKKEETEGKLAAKSEAYDRERKLHAAGLQEVAAALPEGAALLAYVRYDDLGPPELRPAEGEDAPSKLVPKPVPSYLAFALRASGEAPALVALGPADRIDRLVDRWRDAIVRGGRSPTLAADGSGNELREAGTELRKAIWDPVASRIGAAPLVLVVPDGSIHLVSFAALPQREGRFLVDARTFHCLSAERDLSRPVPEGIGRGLLAVGAPDFDHPSRTGTAGAPTVASSKATATGEIYRGPLSACADFRDMRFSSLPDAEAEARIVERSWSKGPDRSDVLRLSGASASEEAVKRSIAGRRVVHLATHGFFSPDACGKPIAAEESPLLRSGLALAGANLRNRPRDGGDAEDDGVLTAEEIASLDLSKAEWVVLSACETGLGEVRNGEGVLGLRRAFEVAGARSLLMSLWDVEDASTRQWMRALYAARRNGASTADAVRRASLELLEERRRRGLDTSPFYWGAFVSAGDWR